MHPVAWAVGPLWGSASAYCNGGAQTGSLEPGTNPSEYDSVWLAEIQPNIPSGLLHSGISSLGSTSGSSQNDLVHSTGSTASASSGTASGSSTASKLADSAGSGGSALNSTYTLSIPAAAGTASISASTGTASPPASTGGALVASPTGAGSTCAAKTRRRLLY